jgi:dihydrofolate reductase
MRRLTYHIAVSLDGYIAATDGSFDGFAQVGDHIDALVRDVPETLPGHVLAAMGIHAPNDTYDTVVMGWNTYSVGLAYGIKSPYPHLRQHVVSRTHQPGEVGDDVRLVSGDPVALIRELKAESSTKEIWLCGGGTLARTLRNEIDRLVLKINPVLLGSGIPVFAPGPPSNRSFVLESTRAFESGVLMTSYRAADF